MAHFAQINENNLVTQVIVVDNNDILDGDGRESEQVGAQFCLQFGAGPWIQTSYSRKFRQNFAVVGATYDPVLDVFKLPNE